MHRSGGADNDAEHLPTSASGEPTERDRQAEGAGLDAYSQVVTRVAEVLLPSVASLRVGSRRVGQGIGVGRGHHRGRVPRHLGPRRGRRRPAGSAAFGDGRELPFEVTGVDRLSDLAVVRVSGGGLQPARLGDADRPARRPAGRRRRQPPGLRRLGQRRRGQRPRPVVRGRRAGATPDSSRTSSRPTPPSTPATPAAPWPTAPAGGRHQHRRRRARHRPGPRPGRPHQRHHPRASSRS